MEFVLLILLTTVVQIIKAAHNSVKPKKIWSNLAVSDLERTTNFYTDLGFEPNDNSKELTSFFVGKDDFVMHFFLEDILKTSIKVEIIDSQNANEVLYTLSAESKDQVITDRQLS